ncbi:E3 ubiquitin-protein ligase TRIM56-like [Argopecten irradians]|uniref:E3 ubiquitin-protein ligase TRIM56-like n=1 Tax=Argopecten irradians TaxID=31199 RepID=UPI0037143BC5
MTARDIVEEVRNDLNCSICLDVLNDPRILSCGHTFCFECIQNAYTASHLTHGICPLCQETYFVPRRDIGNLRRNFTVNNVLHTLQSADCRCAVCQSHDGKLICSKCKLNLCRHCSRRDTIKCNHELLQREELDSRPFLRDVIQGSRSKQTCSSHPDNDVKFFCHTCKRVMCYTCRLLEHPHHVTVEINEALRKLRERNIPGQIGSKVRRLDKAIENLARFVLVNPSIQEVIRRFRALRTNCTDFRKRQELSISVLAVTSLSSMY